MLEPYRRDAVSKSLFHLTEILGGASFVYVWLSAAVAVENKIALGVFLVVIFMIAWLACPNKPPDKEG